MQNALQAIPCRRHLRTALIFATLGLLSACASHGPSVSANQAAYDYAAHAKGNYQPPGPASDPWGPYIRLASERFDVPEPWIRQVMRVESGGHEYIDGQLTVSPVGAMGLMQIMPATYQELAGRYGLGNDPFNPYDNILAGTAYIHELYQVYGSPGFLAAYNAGPGRLDAYLDYHKPLPAETRNYVAMIAPNIRGVYPTGHAEADQLAMNQLPAHIAPGIRAGYAPPAPMPSVPVAPDAPVQMAALAPPSVAETPRYTPQHALNLPPSQRGFSLIPRADAAVPQAGNFNNTGSGWAIQVGAYDSQSHANAALGIAELTAVKMLIKGQPMIAAVTTGNKTIYRARVVHLPHDAALQACQRLTGGPTGCVVLSPDAQS